MLKNKYRALFFDAGGTLFRPNPSVGTIYAQVALAYGIQVNPEEVERIFRLEFESRDKQIALKAHSSEKNEKEWWKNLVRAVFEKAKVTSLFGEHFDEYFEELYDLFARAEVWQLYPEARDLLETLQTKNLILGIVSNWDSRLFSICEEMDVKKYFKFILASAVVGSAKPHRGIFEEALKCAGVTPEEALHVGDSVENDFWGARGMGIDALLINRNKREVENVKSIASLSDILNYLS